MVGIYSVAHPYLLLCVLRPWLARRGKAKINKCEASGACAVAALGEFSFRVKIISALFFVLTQFND